MKCDLKHQESQPSVHIWVDLQSKLGYHCVCDFKRQQILHVCLTEARTSSLQLRCIFSSWRSRFWYRWSALAAPQKQHLMRALAATCSGKHSIRQPYLWWILVPLSIWHPAWLNSCGTRPTSHASKTASCRQCSSCDKQNLIEKTSPTKIYRGQASRNSKRDLWQPKDQHHDALAPNDRPPNIMVFVEIGFHHTAFIEINSSPHFIRSGLSAPRSYQGQSIIRQCCCGRIWITMTWMPSDHPCGVCVCEGLLHTIC